MSPDVFVTYLPGRSLSVCVTAVANTNDINQMAAIRNAIHHASLPNANAPKVRGALQFHNSGRVRVCH